MKTDLYLKKKNGAEVHIEDILSLSYYKDVYSPYSRLTLTAVRSKIDFPDDCIAVRFCVGQNEIHCGIVDRYQKYKENNIDKIIVNSRGYTSLLTENQLPPGMYTDMSINRLFNEHISFGNITHEDNDESSYIFVKRGTPVWDGIANLTYKLKGSYPYIRGCNTVMMSMPNRPKELTLQDSEILKIGKEIVTNKMASNFHMENLSGEYGEYDCTVNEALERGIVRHRYFELDRRFLSSPDKAGEYRAALATQGCERKIFTYYGYHGEDLNDLLTHGEMEQERIKAIKIIGRNKVVTTELKVYNDRFSQ